jgi:hypothetical protein
MKTYEQFINLSYKNSDLIKLNEYHIKNDLSFFKKIGYNNVNVEFELWTDSGKKDPTQFDSERNIIQINPDFVKYILQKGDTCGWLIHETAHYIAHAKNMIDDNVEYPANKIERFTYSCQFKYLQENGLKSIDQLANDKYFKHEFLGGVNKNEKRIQILSLYWKMPDIWINNPNTITSELQKLIKN